MSFWDKCAPLYDAAQRTNYKVLKQIAQLTEQLVPQGAVVLDTAAGTGNLTFAAAKKAAHVTCTDLSVPMLEGARRKAVRLGADNVSFEARNIFDLCDPDNTYDVVMAGNVLHLLANPQGAVRELCRVTKPGGLILLPTFMLWKGSELVELYKLVGFKPAENYSPKKYREMLEGCGCGAVKARLLKGMIPCCYAVIQKPLAAKL